MNIVTTRALYSILYIHTKDIVIYIKKKKKTLISQLQLGNIFSVTAFFLIFSVRLTDVYCSDENLNFHPYILYMYIYTIMYAVPIILIIQYYLK